MSAKFVTVQWTRVKVIYDLVVLVTIAAYVLLFERLGRTLYAGAAALSPQIVSMRAWGSCAFLLLTVILCIGPLARLDKRFAPILYNRRHLGVMMSVVASVHAYQVLGYYHAYGSLKWLDSLLINDAAFTEASVPFQLFGAGALLIVLMMAVISHDFWQKALGPRLWKSLHMGVYLAYVLVLVHVAFGTLQWEAQPAFAGLIVALAVIVCGLHLWAARISTAADRRSAQRLELDGVCWVDAGSVAEILALGGRACPVVVPGQERIALVCHAGAVSAVHGVCAHQGGPLYEGRIVDGCLTCPWHGWQYRPEDGQSPPPFDEKLPTYEVRVHNDRVLVNPRALPAGTASKPALLRPPDQSSERADRLGRSALEDSESSGAL